MKLFNSRRECAAQETASDVNIALDEGIHKETSLQEYVTLLHDNEHTTSIMNDLGGTQNNSNATASLTVSSNVVRPKLRHLHLRISQAGAVGDASTHDDSWDEELHVSCDGFEVDEAMQIDFSADRVQRFSDVAVDEGAHNETSLQENVSSLPDYEHTSSGMNDTGGGTQHNSTASAGLLVSSKVVRQKLKRCRFLISQAGADGDASSSEDSRDEELHLSYDGFEVDEATQTDVTADRMQRFYIESLRNVPTGFKQPRLDAPQNRSAIFSQLSEESDEYELGSFIVANDYVSEEDEEYSEEASSELRAKGKSSLPRQSRNGGNRQRIQRISESSGDEELAKLREEVKGDC